METMLFIQELFPHLLDKNRTAFSLGCIFPYYGGTTFLSNLPNDLWFMTFSSGLRRTDNALGLVDFADVVPLIFRRVMLSGFGWFLNVYALAHTPLCTRGGLWGAPTPRVSSQVLCPAHWTCSDLELSSVHSTQ